MGHGGAAPSQIRRGGAKIDYSNPPTPRDKPKPLVRPKGKVAKVKKEARKYRVDKNAGPRPKGVTVGNWNTGGKFVKKVGQYMYRQMNRSGSNSRVDRGAGGRNN
jgi:hypothetical protein